MTLAALTMFALVTGTEAHGDDKGKVDKEKQAVKQAKLDSQRAQIDAMARESLERLMNENPEARTIQEKSYGYAVFDTTKVALGLSGGGGAGVAVSKNDRIYMRMATAGVGLGAGAQNYQVILFFDDKAAFDYFLSEGWNAEASADAGAGDRGTGSIGTTARGITIFKLSDVGLMANMDLSGTRFWKADDLNQ
jgi:lipid-binding SYLF domain-containing protein